MGWACSAYGGQERGIDVLVRRADGKRPLGRPRCRWGIPLKLIFKKLDGEV